MTLNGTTLRLELSQCIDCDITVLQTTPLIVVEKSSNCKFSLNDEYSDQIKMHCSGSNEISTTNDISPEILNSNNILNLTESGTDDFVICRRGHETTSKLYGAQCSWCVDTKTGETVYYCLACQTFICQKCSNAFELDRQLIVKKETIGQSMIDSTVLQRV